MTPARFETRVRDSLRALVTGKATEDQVTASILADSCDQAAWWIEQADRGERWKVTGERIREPEGGAA